MSRTKIAYGIDLGTTNSAIALMENGKIGLIKSDKYQKDITPSCVQFNKKKAVFAGEDALNRYRYEALKAFKDFSRSDPRDIGIVNTFIEFKRTMGTDKQYRSAYMNRSFSSEELSAEVLKKLKSYVRDEDIRAAVITVPAKFRQNQIDATQRAAELAGFKYCELLQEPIAASLAYGIDTQDMDGCWLVFDLGGGTFDAALMKTVGGIMKVTDTEGDNHLGGKNIDYAIADHLFIPYLKAKYKIEGILADEYGRSLLRDALKRFAEETKIALSSETSFEVYSDEPLGKDDEGNDIELDMRVTSEEFEKAAMPVFQRAVDISLRLLENNGLKGSDLKTAVLTGGPTLSRTLRKMLSHALFGDSDRLSDPLPDPMTAVAKGAAIFASTRDIPLSLQQRDRAKIQLTLRFPETTVETEEFTGIRIERDRTLGKIPDKLFAEMIRNDKAWSCGKIEISNEAEVIPVLLNPGTANTFTISLSDAEGTLYPCEPDSFTVIQGMKAANPTLPFALCIEASDARTGRQLLQPLRGSDKNQSLPAKGKGIFKTQKTLCPGNRQDLIRIPIYEGQPGTKAIYNTRVHEIFITGQDLPEILPEDTEAEITLEIDSSRRMRLSAYFSYIDETFHFDLPDNTTKDYDVKLLEGEIRKAGQSLIGLEKKCPEIFRKSGNELKELETLLENAGRDQDSKTHIMERLREVMKEMDKAAEDAEWPETEQALGKALKRTAVTHQRYGNEKTAQIIEAYTRHAQTIVLQKNVKTAKDLIAEIHALDFSLKSQDIGLWISYIRKFDEQFEVCDWKDKASARELINEAESLIASKPSKAELQHIVRQLSALLPQTAGAVNRSADEELLRTTV